ncbi:MAG: 60S ribosomal export protein NMD3 [Thermoplasmata archaeon]|nr:60S ribosomal export protein NMD3 [Thermoplasmata archaeon]
MLCPKCGKTVSQLHSGLCIDCVFTEKVPVHVSERIEMLVCTDCGAVLVGRHWEKFETENDALKKLIYMQLECSPGFRCTEIDTECEKLDRNVLSCEAKLSLEYDGEVHEQKRQVTIFRRKNLCPDCSRIHGHGFSAVIQIRRKGREIGARLLREMEDIVEGAAAGKRQVVQREDVENGVDIYIVDNGYARAVCEALKRKFGARVKASPRLHTRREGKDVYRVTYLVEIERFEDGDLVYYDGDLYTVAPERAGKLLLRNQGGKERVVMGETLKNAEIIEFEMLDELKVVYRDEKEITVLDERTMKLEKFTNIDYPQAAEKVWVLKREDNIYLVPLRSVKKMRGEAE